MVYRFVEKKCQVSTQLGWFGPQLSRCFLFDLGISLLFKATKINNQHLAKALLLWRTGRERCRPGVDHADGSEHSWSDVNICFLKKCGLKTRRQKKEQFNLFAVRLQHAPVVCPHFERESSPEARNTGASPQVLFSKSCLKQC